MIAKVFLCLAWICFPEQPLSSSTEREASIIVECTEFRDEWMVDHFRPVFKISAPLVSKRGGVRTQIGDELFLIDISIRDNKYVDVQADVRLLHDVHQTEFGMSKSESLKVFEEHGMRIGGGIAGRQWKLSIRRGSGSMPACK